MTSGMPPARERSVATNRPPGLRSASSGTRALIASKSSIASGTPDSRAIASRCSTALVEPPLATTAAIAFSIAGRVITWLGRSCRFNTSITSTPASRATRCLAGSCGRHAGAAERRDAERLADRGHGVRGELAAARPGTGAGLTLERVEISRGDRTGRVRADRFEHILDRHVAAVPLPRRDRAAVEHQAGDVETRQGHDRGGDGLVAADEHDQRIQEVAARDQLDRIGDDLAADQGRPHPLAAHGDPVGDRDRVEFEGGAAGLANSRLDVGSQLAQVEVAGADLGPGVGDADQRPTQVLVSQPGGAQHRPGGRPARAFGQPGAAPFQLVRPVQQQTLSGNRTSRTTLPHELK